MSLTPNYDPTPLAPKLLIQNLTDVTQYTFETSVTNASPTRDFNLRALGLDLGINDDWGKLSLLIDDPQNLLTDSTTRRTCKIQNQWNVQLELGKSPSTKNRWFYGKVLESGIIRPNTNLQQVRLLCVGWGIRLHDRVTKIKRFQAKTSDGITLDSTDTAAKVSELAKDVVQDVDHFADLSQTAESGLTTTQVADIDVKLADFQQNYQTFAGALSQLAAASGAIMTVDADRDLVMRVPSSSDSGFLFTNNLSGLDAQGWDDTKIGYLFRAPFEWNDSSYEAAISNLIGINASIINKDVEQTSSNATRSLHLSWLAVPFVHNIDNIAKLAMSLAKTGTPAEIADFRIVGRDGSNLPNINDLRKQLLLAKEKCQTFSAGAGAWVELGFEETDNITVKEQLFLVIKKYGSASHTFVADYQTGAGTYYTSSDGITWGSNTGNFKFRSYGANPAQVIVENTVTRNKYGLREKVIPFNQKTQQEAVLEILTGISDVVSKERRIYSDIIVSPPTAKIPLGKTCRIQDSFSGLDVSGEVVGVRLKMAADDIGNIGTNQISLSVMEFK